MPIHLVKGVFARRVTVKHGPALDLLIQPLDQFPRRATAGALDGFLDLTQERPHVLAGRFHQDLAARVTADGLSQEIEAVVDRRDPGLLVGERRVTFETPLLEEVSHERHDFMSQQFLRRAGDDKVIRITHQVDLATPFAAAGEVLRQQWLKLPTYLRRSLRSVGRGSLVIEHLREVCRL